MNKFIITLFASLCLLPFGCIDDSSSSSKSEYKPEIQCTVQGKSPTNPSGTAGYLDCGSFQIVVEEGTPIASTRESCSGSELVTFQQLKLGADLFVRYDKIEYANNPTVVYATTIRSIAPECQNPIVLPPDECSTCSNDFFK